MPSPAQDTFSSVVQPTRGTLTRSWVPTDPVPIDTGVIRVQTAQGLNCPATVVNLPVNGRRPMSGWNKTWFRGNMLPTSWRIKHVSGRSVSEYEYSNSMPYIGLPQSKDRGQFWGTVGSFFPFTPSLEFTSDAGARTNVLNKVGQKKWDLGVSALELRQTARLVTDLATGMAKTVENLINSRASVRQQVDNFFRRVRQHGSFDKAAAEVGITDIGLLDFLKDSWMQYQFGVKPTLRDINDGVEWLASQQQQEIPMIVYGKSGHTVTRSYAGVDGGTRLLKCWPSIEEECQTHYSVLYEIPTGQVRALTSLGLDNPWNIGWEVTRLSWMVDYVVGVGDWLSSFTATNGMVFREGCRSTLKRIVARQFHSEPGKSIGADVTLPQPPNLSGAWAEHGSFRRNILISGVTPAVVPPIRSTLGLTQLGNSLFALSNVFAGKGALR